MPDAAERLSAQAGCSLRVATAALQIARGDYKDACTLIFYPPDVWDIAVECARQEKRISKLEERLEELADRQS